jgi:RND family efflux transporter MFP subunit
MKEAVAKLIPKVIGRIVLIVVIIGVAFGLKTVLASMKREPAQKTITERPLTVEGIEIHPEDVPVTITGYGQVRALDIVEITAEVSGTVTAVHPRLEPGEVIPKGDLLFSIDQRNYEAALEQAAAIVGQQTNQKKRLERQYAIEKDRLKTLERSKALAKTEYDRLVTLEDSGVGTQSAADQAEIALNQAQDRYDQLAQSVDLYPIQIAEAQSALLGARASEKLAKANLDRCEIRAPFNVRLKMVSLEQGQYVRPGTPVLTLANDAELEISVPLDSRDVRSWLQFDHNPTTGLNTWFSPVTPVRARVRWTEESREQYWEGVVHRVEGFDQNTRTVNVAIRISGKDAAALQTGLPLVDGMYCAVQIPGKPMKQVYRLPRWAVSYEGDVYVAEDNRLRVRNVEIVRSQGEETFVSTGLSPGDTVLTTRLVNPLPGTLLELAEPQPEEATL